MKQMTPDEIEEQIAYYTARCRVNLYERLEADPNWNELPAKARKKMLDDITPYVEAIYRFRLLEGPIERPAAIEPVDVMPKPTPPGVGY